MASILSLREFEEAVDRAKTSLASNGIPLACEDYLLIPPLLSLNIRSPFGSPHLFHRGPSFFSRPLTLLALFREKNLEKGDGCIEKEGNSVKGQVEERRVKELSCETNHIPTVYNPFRPFPPLQYVCTLPQSGYVVLVNIFSVSRNQFLLIPKHFVSNLGPMEQAGMFLSSSSS
jgi:hypothetical protein